MDLENRELLDGEEILTAESIARNEVASPNLPLSILIMGCWTCVHQEHHKLEYCSHNW